MSNIICILKYYPNDLDPTYLESHKVIQLKFSKNLNPLVEFSLG